MSEINGMMIRVAGNDYEVKTCNELAVTHALMGQCVFGTNTIKVADGLCENRQHDVLIHELFHAIMYEAGYDEHEEEIVNRVAKVLYQVLRDNDFGFMHEEEDELEALY